MLNTVENLKLNIYIKENKMRKLKESAMAELDIAAQEAATFEAFVQTVKQEFPQLAKDLNKSEVISFLQNLYDDSKVKQENKMKVAESTLIKEEEEKGLPFLLAKTWLNEYDSNIQFAVRTEEIIGFLYNLRNKEFKQYKGEIERMYLPYKKAKDAFEKLWDEASVFPDKDLKEIKQENKTTMKKSQLAQIIREEIQKMIAEAEPDFSKVDSILKGTYKRPAAKVDPKIKKIAGILDTLVSKPFDSAKLEDILNALGPIEPMKLESAIDMMKTSVFELNDGYPFYNLEVRSNNYTDKGVALSWEDDGTWRAG